MMYLQSGLFVGIFVFLALALYESIKIGSGDIYSILAAIVATAGWAFCYYQK